MNKLTFLLLFFLLSLPGLAQELTQLEFRELGPFRGGRVTSVGGVASLPGTFYLGATGAGVWKTEDYGTTWNNVSDGFFETPSIGALAVAQNDPNIVYVGTGSDGLRSNVIAGKGVYKSIDGGENWIHVGLDNVGQIGALVIHPQNHNIVYVAAIGQAFNANPERGIYKTTNGGKTWTQVLGISSTVGFYDVELMPSNPEIIYATAWKAERKPWTIISGGTPEEGGIYKSMDGGLSWSKIENGLPNELIGKIDVAVTPADSRMVYALVEAPGDEGGLYVSVDQGESFSLVSNEKSIRTRPFYYTNVRVDPKDANKLYVLATSYSRSLDGGKSWERISSPHGDNHDMWINPNNPDLFIQANDGGANVTHNGGKSWSTQFNQPTAEIYQIEVDDQFPYWVYGGQQDNYSTVAVPTQAPYGIQSPGTGYIINTGGCETGPAVPKPGDPNIVYSNCKGRFGVFDKRTGVEKSYYVGASNMYGHNPKELKYRFQRVSPIHVSPHNPNVVYHCSQFVHRTKDEGKTWETISPDLTAFEEDKQVISGAPITRDITGEEFYSTIYAIQESTIKQGVIWVGSNDGLVHVTTDDGESWKNVTPKMPAGGRVDGVEPSHFDPETAWFTVLRYQLGDWKPYIYRTTNSGKSWKLVSGPDSGLPQDYPVRVVREDPKMEGLLFAGTEYGLFVSYNSGDSWEKFQQNLPVTPVTDIKLHRDDLVLSTMGRGFWIMDDISTLRQLPEDYEQVVLFKPRDTYRYWYPSGARVSSTPSYPRAGVYIDYYLPEAIDSTFKLEIQNESGQVVATFLSDSSTNKIAESYVRDMSTEQVEYLVSKSLVGNKGFNRFKWDLSMAGPWHKDDSRRYQSGPMAKAGLYNAKLTINGTTQTQSFRLLMDPKSSVSTQDIDEQMALVNEVSQLLSEARKLEDQLKKEKEKLEKTENPTQEEKQSLSELTTTLDALSTPEDQIYPKPMLVSQIGYLYNMITGADQVPGKDAYERYEELKKEYAELLEGVNLEKS